MYIDHQAFRYLKKTGAFKKKKMKFMGFKSKQNLFLINNYLFSKFVQFFKKKNPLFLDWINFFVILVMKIRWPMLNNLSFPLFLSLLAFLCISDECSWKNNLFFYKLIPCGGLTFRTIYMLQLFVWETHWSSISYLSYF